METRMLEEMQSKIRGILLAKEHAGRCVFCERSCGDASLVCRPCINKRLYAATATGLMAFRTIKPKTQYEANYLMMREQLETGDKVLFAGGGLLSRAIRLGSFGPWSHIGFIVRKDNRIYVTESTSLNKWGKSGVDTHLLSVRMKQYPGKIAIRRLVGFSRTPETLRISDAYLEEMRGKTYEASVWQVVGAAMPWRNVEDFSSVFCSEYAAGWDIRMGILDRSLPASEYHPNDYGEGRLVDRKLSRKGCYSKLTSEIRIK